jgi:hypothetical protein
VHREAERLARRALSAALDPGADSLRAGALAVRLIAEADPPAQATLEVSADLTPEGVDQLSYSELIQVAHQFGIDPS